MPLERIKVRPTTASSPSRKPFDINVIDGEKVELKPPPSYTRSYNDRQSWFAVFYRYVPVGIGIPGIKYAFNPREIRPRRLIWLLLVLAAFCVMSYQIITRCIFFASSPKDVDITIKYRSEVPFPSVAICNMNVFNKSSTKGTVFYDFLRDSAMLGYSVSMPLYQADLEAYDMTSMSREMAHSIESTLVEMSWNGVPLDHSNFTLRVSDVGICIMFNDVDNGQPQLMVQSSGKRHGLTLLLNAAQDEYYYNYYNRKGAGFQVLLYDYGTEPVVEKGGFAIGVGIESVVEVDIIEYHNLEPPHGECENKTLEYYDTYGYSECVLTCQSDFMAERCGCKCFAMRNHVRECNVYEFFGCISTAYHTYVEGLHEQSCHCPVPCDYREYTTSISSLTYPSLFWSNTTVNGQSISAEVIKNNACSLVIFMKDLSIETISQQIKYPFFSLLCDIGGSLGLWLGGSILTLFEVFDLFGYATYVYSTRRPR